MKRHRVRAIIAVVVLLLAVTLLTGFASPPSAEAEVPLFFYETSEGDRWLVRAILFVIFVGPLLLVIRWAWQNPFDKKPPE